MFWRRFVAFVVLIIFARLCGRGIVCVLLPLLEASSGVFHLILCELLEGLSHDVDVGALRVEHESILKHEKHVTKELNAVCDHLFCSPNMQIVNFYILLCGSGGMCDSHTHTEREERGDDGAKML